MEQEAKLIEENGTKRVELISGERLPFERLPTYNIPATLPHDVWAIVAEVAGTKKGIVTRPR